MTDKRQNATVGESTARPKAISLFSYLREGYWYIFGRLWPAWLGGLLLGLANFAMFAYVSPWFIY